MENSKSNLTRWGVAHNLRVSPYKKIIDYGENVGVLTFYFSSQLILDIFEKKLKQNRETINKSLSKRFGFEIVNDILCDIKLYSVTEKRGFLIEKENDKEGFEWKEHIILNGVQLMKNS